MVPAALLSVLALVEESSAPVLTGCARGCDRAVVERLGPRVTVFRVSGVGRGAFAARSTAFVRALAAAGGTLLSFPAGPCPAGVVPSSSWRSASGSGSLGSLALAVGLGVPCVVWLAGEPPAWGFSPLGGGWWSICPPVQLSV